MHPRYLLFLLLFPVVCCFVYAGPPDDAPPQEPIPVIYDTDLGEDIDDAWALAFLAQSPELELKLVTVGFGNARAKAKMAAKILAATGQDHVPVAVGKSTGHWAPKYVDWAEDFNRNQYPGEISGDGVNKLVKTIMNDQTGRIKIIAVGPMQNISAALKREPEIVDRVDELIAMSGSIHRGYGSDDKADAESNVRCEVGASQRVYRADWKKFSIAPLDTAGTLKLDGQHYKTVLNSSHPAAATVINAYKEYVRNREGSQWKRRSTTLYDTLAVYMAWSTEYVDVEELPLRVTDKGVTTIDREEGHPVYSAIKWKDKAAFKDLLVRRLTTHTRLRAITGPDRVVEDTDAEGRTTVKLLGSSTGVPPGEGPIEKYRWTEDGQLIANGPNPEVKLDHGAHNITLEVTDPRGVSDTAEVSIFVDAGVPDELKSRDIGQVNPDGGAWYGGGMYRLKSAGADIWGEEDDFHYLYRSIKGDARITARVLSVDHTHPWAKAGVMIREQIAADSKNALMTATAGKGASFQHRASAGEKTRSKREKDNQVPCYIRLTRKDDRITGSVSRDGENWHEVGNITLSMEEEIHIGLALTSHRPHAAGTALFQDLTIRNLPD